MMTKSRLTLSCLLSILVLNACADVNVPEARNVDIPSPVAAQEREEAINERDDSVMYLPLGRDVLVPERLVGDTMPTDFVGPFELRGETLAGALQLILSDYDVSIAFETEAGLTRKVTVANLRGSLDKVVNRVCSLADLYCSYEDETLVIKDTQTFTVTLPPLTDADGNEDYISDIIQGLTAIIGSSGTAPVSDPTTRSLIYSATQRTAQIAENYFQRLRANTAMIVFETYIWEVSLNGGNSTGIDWNAIESFGKFNTNITIDGSVGGDFLSPISIGLPTTQATSPTDVIQFISQFGAVKTISQPKITVLSGAQAELRVADTQNFVSEVSQTINGDNTTTSVDTDSVDSGFTLTIGSSWDKSTVYANVNINLTNVDTIEDFTFSDSGATGTDTIIQLPQTTERELTTQIRVRPGDSVLIAGLVRERDNFDTQGPGFMKPVIPDSRTAQTENLELVILLKPRVVVYTDAKNNRFKQYGEANDQQVSQEVYMPKKSLRKAMKMDAAPVHVVPPTPAMKPVMQTAVVETPEPVAAPIQILPPGAPAVEKAVVEEVIPVVEQVEQVLEEEVVIEAPQEIEVPQKIEVKAEAPVLAEKVKAPSIPEEPKILLQGETARAKIIVNNDLNDVVESDSIPEAVEAVEEVKTAQPIVVPAESMSENTYVGPELLGNPFLNSDKKAAAPRVSVRPNTNTNQGAPSITDSVERISPDIEVE